MMNRRRTFHFSPAASEFLSTPDGGTVGSSLLGRKTDLERKLELLEARFTMPLDQSSASAVTAAAASNKHDNNDNNSSPATLDPENSSPASIPSTTNTNANNNSQHSFGFGTPSLTYYPPDTADKKSTTIAQRISSSPLVVANANAFHPSRLACTESGGGCDWQEIATAHVAKQMALLQQQQQQLPDADSQDRTLLTSHVQPPPPPEIGAATHDKNTSGSSSSHPATLTAFCVQESPPLVTSNRDLNHNKGTTVVAVNDKETDGVRILFSMLQMATPTCSDIQMVEQQRKSHWSSPDVELV